MDYEVKLYMFEGPLDLLLHLISKAKIELEDIFISEVTEQYLQYMSQIGDVDMDKMSDFLSMASTLLYIKSRSLLPGKNDFAGDGEDVEQQLIERLRAYKAFKVVCVKLRECEAQAGGVYFKLPEELPDIIAPVVWENTDAQALYAAFLEVLSRKKHDVPRYEKVEVTPDSFSVRLQTKKIQTLLAGRRRLSFDELFEGQAQPMEIAVTFLALLQLWHSGKLTVRQSSGFGKITLCAA